MCDVFDVVIPSSERQAAENIKRAGREAIVGSDALDFGNGANPQSEEREVSEEKKSSDETEKERKEKQLFNQAARLFTLFAKVGPIGGQVSHGITPQRRVDFFELFAVLAVLCRGSMPEKSHLLFAVFDVNGR